MLQRKTYLFLPVSFLVFALYFLFLAPRAIGAHIYTLETWTVEEGLPQNSVLCLLQDRTGYIWFGTQSGLVRFDGAAFRIYNRWNTPHYGHLRSDTITALYQDGNNTLWIGTEGGGLSCMKKNGWRSYSTKEGLPNDFIRAIYGDGEGNLWIGTANGLARLNVKEETLQVYTDDDLWGDAVTAITGSSSGGLWIGTGDNGLYVVKDNTYQRFNPKDEPAREKIAEITALCEDRSGCLWIGTEKGLFCLEKGRIRTPVPENHPLAGNTIRTLMPDSSGSLWIGTDGEGIYRLTAGTFTAIPFRHGLSDDFIYALFEDREANVWIGTYTSGLARLTSARVTSITTENGLPQNLVRTLTEDRDGYLWVGMDRKGAAKIKNDKIIDKILPGTRLNAIYRDSTGSLWLGTRGSGVIRLENGNPDLSFTYTTRDGLSSDEITVIRGDRSDILWVGTTNGLNRFENGRFTSLTAFKEKNIKAIEESKTLWLGTGQGLLQLKGERWEAVLTGEGNELGYDILCLYFDHQGNLWLGTNGSGLGRLQLNNGAFTLYTTDAGLPHNYIFSILEDRQKNLWMSSYRGVFRVSRAQLDALAQKKISLLRPLCLDETDGMRSRECVKGGQPSAWKSFTGKLYFPTVKGLAVIDPAALRINRIPPPVIIEEVLINNEPAAADEKTVFPAGKNIIEFYFTALSFTAPGRVKLRYKLEGFDTRWEEVTPRLKRTALYLNLNPGSYRFNVIACNNDGLWNDKPAVFEFKIESPFYKQPLFYLLIVLILVAAAAGALWFSRKKEEDKQIKPQEPKYKTSALLPETVEQVLPRLMKLMEEEKVFLNADLTLKPLAARLNVHYNYLSQIINEQMKQSFNDFINNYRIEEARKKLVDPAEKDKTVLDIAYETGFYSKSVFNTAFKKFTGMTPSEFRRREKETT